MSDIETHLDLQVRGKGKARIVIATPEAGDPTILGRYDLVEESGRAKLTEDIHERFIGFDIDDVRRRVEDLALRIEMDFGAVGGGGRSEGSQANELVKLAEELFEVFPGDDGDVYAVHRGGAATALSLGGGHDSLRERLASEFYERNKRVPRSASISDAMVVIGGLAKKQPRRPVHLRAAAVAGGYEIDIGDESGRCISVTPAGWEVRDRASVHFYRTAITLPMAVPERGASLTEFWSVMNVSEPDQPIVLAYAAVALMPDRESPVFMANGQKGSGKSSIARAITAVCDPTVGAVRTPPTRPDQWSITAAGSRVVAIDNVSQITQWLSDAFCRATTGDAYLARALYSNKSLSAVQFRIALMITAIDAGAIRDDLGDRCIVIRAPVIPGSKMIADRQIKMRLAAMRGRLLGALLDLMVKVLAELPHVVLEELPRIGDFYTVLAAVDRVLGTDGLAAFADQAQRIADDVIESDTMSTTLLEFMQGRDEWAGTSKELITALWGNSHPKGAPTEPRAISSNLRRMEQTLLLAGLVVTPPGPNERPRNWVLKWGPRSDGCSSSSDRRTVGETPPTTPPSGFSSSRRSSDGGAEDGEPTDGTETVGADSTAGDARRSDVPDGLPTGQNDNPNDERAPGGANGHTLVWGDSARTTGSGELPEAGPPAPRRRRTTSKRRVGRVTVGKARVDPLPVDERRSGRATKIPFDLAPPSPAANAWLDVDCAACLDTGLEWDPGVFLRICSRCSNKAAAMSADGGAA